MNDYTPRGFRIYTTFHDSAGHRVTVQQSSSAIEPKVWIFCNASPDCIDSPHLTVDDAKMVRSALDQFIAEATS